MLFMFKNSKILSMQLLQNKLDFGVNSETTLLLYTESDGKFLKNYCMK